jgi:hypothetical protein
MNKTMYVRDNTNQMYEVTRDDNDNIVEVKNVTTGKNIPLKSDTVRKHMVRRNMSGFTVKA